MVFEFVVSVTEHPVVVVHLVLQEDGFALHSTPHDDAVPVEHFELDSLSLSSGSLFGFGGGLGSLGPGKSVPGPQPIRHGLLQNRRQGLPQLIRQGAGGRPGLKFITGRFGSRSVCICGNGGGVIILITGGCLTPGLFLGFGSSVILKGGGDTLLVTSIAREVGRSEPVSRIFQTPMAVVITVRKISLAESYDVSWPPTWRNCKDCFLQRPCITFNCHDGSSGNSCDDCCQPGYVQGGRIWWKCDSRSG